MAPISQLKHSKTTLHNTSRYYGVDGCRGGWILACFSQGEISFSLHENVTALIKSLVGCPAAAPSPAADRSPSTEPPCELPSIFIDIPIGLPESGERLCDRKGRELLGARRSTLFPVPIRSAVYAPTFEECGNKNLLGQGRRVSIQFWNITKKVIEVDHFLQTSPKFIGKLCEAHPELAFSRLVGEVIPLSKHSSEGRVLRVQAIERATGTDVSQSVKHFVQRNKKVCCEGDLIDAASLALLCSLHAAKPRFAGDSALDSHGIPMRIAI